MVRRVWALAWMAWVVVAVPAAAQPLGTFRWQLQPYCNIVSVTVVQQGAQYQLDGTDDQCGAGQKASVNGLAFFNLDGSVGFGLNLVTTPGGVPVHVDAAISIATLSGTWRDSAGGTGAFTFTPGAGTGGAPRPAAIAGDITAVTAGAGLTGGAAADAALLAVDFATTQQRVSGTCPANQLMTGVNQDGTVTCQSVTAAGGGDITGVTAGTGLTGGGPSGDVSLAVNFGGPGAAPLAARSDHQHQVGDPAMSNIAVGPSALVGPTGAGNTAMGTQALQFNAAGPLNSAFGFVALRTNTTGSSNTAVGAAALRDSTIGSFNTAIGSQSLLTNSSGSTNTAVGGDALLLNTIGGANTAVGYQSLRANTVANFNTAIGRLAMQFNTTGYSNTAVGSAALTFNLFGVQNVAIGGNALTMNGASDTTAVGFAALRLNTTGLLNTAVGARALENNVTGGNNTAVGTFALTSTTANANTAIGAVALASNTTGPENTAVGNSALSANTTASFNTAVGALAMLSTTTGGNNTAVGRIAMQSNTTGASNTAVGAGALTANTAGIENVAIGLNALSQNTASENTAVGYAALDANTVGLSNTAVGHDALGSNTTGAVNTALGKGSLPANVTGTNNTAVGDSALQHNVSGNNNVAVGHQAGLGLVSGSQNTYVGAGVSAVAGESNTIRIGSALATATFIRGINGATSSGGVGVFVNASGQLGTSTSSARFKDAITPLGDSLRAKVQALAPVSFVYKPEFDDGSKQTQYGLIAEDVARSFPELLVRDEEGRPQTVRYHLLAPLLLAEVQRLERARDALEARVRALEERLRATGPR